MELGTENMEEAKPELCDLSVKTETEDMYVKQEIKTEDAMSSVTAKIQDIKPDIESSACGCDGFDIKVKCDEMNDIEVKVEPCEVAIGEPEVKIKEPSEMALDDPAVKLEPREVATEEPEVELIKPRGLTMDGPGEVVIIELDKSSEMAMDEHEVEMIKPSEMKLEDSEMWLTPEDKVTTVEPQHEIQPPLLGEGFSQDLRCKLCQKDFDYLADITVHFDIDHTEVYETKYDCYYCKVQLRYKDQQSHYETSHPHMTPLCPICHCSCGDWQNRDLHYQSHFRGSTKQTILSTVSDQPLQTTSISPIVQPTVNGIYNCEDCQYSFLNWSHLKEHLFKEHSLDVPLLAFTCPMCEAPYRSFDGLDKHYLNHFIETKHEGSSYICAICKCSFYFQGSARKHVRMQHGKQLLLVDCIHKVIQDAKLPKLGILSQSMSTQNQDEPTHLREEHRIEKTSGSSDNCEKPPRPCSIGDVCKVCHKSGMDNMLRRRRHAFDDHKDVILTLPAPCSYCIKGETLTLGKLMLHHEKYHKGKGYKCKWCLHLAPTGMALKTHIVEHFFDSTTLLKAEPVHTQTQPTDHHCMVTLSTEGQEKATRSKEDQIPEKTSSISGKSEKPPKQCVIEVVCKICDKKVIKHKHLRRRHVFDDHRDYVMALPAPCSNCSKGKTLILGKLRSHHEKRHKGLCYRCKWCGQNAPTWLALETHVAEHFFDSTNLMTSETDSVPVRKKKSKMYECRECQHMCNDWSDLRHHLTSVHSFNVPVKPFTCPECKFTYSSYTGMDGHYMNHIVKKSKTWTSYECRLCKWKAFTHQAVVSHIKNVHVYTGHNRLTKAQAVVEIQEKARMAKVQKLDDVQHQGTCTVKKEAPVERYQCVKCRLIAKDWLNLRCHLSGAHGFNIPASPFTCCLCSSSCSTWKSLVDHFLDHFVEDVSGELQDQVQCTLCQSPFESHKDAINHLVSEHGAELMTEKNKMTLQVQLAEIQEQAMEKMKSSL